MTRKDIISVLDSVVKQSGFVNSPMDYVIIKERKHNCPFDDYPEWTVMFRLKHSWSDNTVNYSTCTVMIHNFIEVDEVIELSKNINIDEVRKFMDLSNLLLDGFNSIN